MSTGQRARDALGVYIAPGDIVRVIHWGSPVRLTDTGKTGRVRGFTPAGNVQILGLSLDPADDIARGRAVPGKCLAVQRRDGQPGHEGNKSL